MGATDTSFETLVEPYRAALRLHCYRMLGSSHDSDDMVQETLVRAFRARASLVDPGAVRPWLYRIATNVCVDELKQRKRRMRGPELGPPGDPNVPPAAATPDDEWIEPFPSTWLAGDADPATGNPAALYSRMESVALAFVAALQILTPAQRAVLLLRDVVGLSAAETAEALASSVAAANSTLHRARVALEEQTGPRSGVLASGSSPVDRALLERYMRAWETGDLSVIVALLHEDVTLSMPPVPTWIAGKAAVARFFEVRLTQALASHLFRTMFFEANGSLGVCFYRRDPDGTARFFALHLLGIEDGRLIFIDHFMGARGHAALHRAGLPEILPR